jgi:hypothetical protein
MQIKTVWNPDQGTKYLDKFEIRGPGFESMEVTLTDLVELKIVIDTFLTARLYNKALGTAVDLD